MDFYEIVDRLEEMKQEILNDLQAATEEQKDIIEDRFGNLYAGKIYIGENCIALDGENTRRQWNYYAGFEYIEDEYITSIGGLHIYNADNERVAEVLEMLEAQPA